MRDGSGDPGLSAVKAAAAGGSVFETERKHSIRPPTFYIRYKAGWKPDMTLTAAEYKTGGFEKAPGATHERSEDTYSEITVTDARALEQYMALEQERMSLNGEQDVLGTYGNPVRKGEIAIRVQQIEQEQRKMREVAKVLSGDREEFIHLYDELEHIESYMNGSEAHSPSQEDILSIRERLRDGLRKILFTMQEKAQEVWKDEEK